MKNYIKKILNLIYKKEIKGKWCIHHILFFKLKYKIKGGIKVGNRVHMCKPDLESVGKWTYASTDLFIVTSKTTIGSFCSIGSNVVLGHGEHPMNYLSTSPYFYFDKLDFKDLNQVAHNEYWKLEPIHIGNDVWIGEGVFVKNGVTIGDGAIIGARAVVVKDVPPYAIVVGCPARILKYRFDEETIKKLLHYKWWNLDDDIIRQIPYDNIDETLKFLSNLENNKEIASIQK